MYPGVSRSRQRNDGGHFRTIIGIATDEVDAVNAIDAHRKLASMNRSEAAKARYVAAQKAKITLPALRWLDTPVD